MRELSDYNFPPTRYLSLKLTFPEDRASSRFGRAGVTEGLEHGLPPCRSIAPPLGFQDQGAAVSVADHHTVHHVVELAAVATALAQIADNLFGFTAILGVLKHKKDKIYIS